MPDDANVGYGQLRDVWLSSQFEKLGSRGDVPDCWERPSRTESISDISTSWSFGIGPSRNGVVSVGTSLSKLKNCSKAGVDACCTAMARNPFDSDGKEVVESDLLRKVRQIKSIQSGP